MALTDLRLQIAAVVAIIAVLWVLFKLLKLIWKFTFVCLVILGLSFALPAFREWIFNLF